jgi:hypothetical protein
MIFGRSLEMPVNRAELTDEEKADENIPCLICGFENFKDTIVHVHLESYPIVK